MAELDRDARDRNAGDRNAGDRNAGDREARIRERAHRIWMEEGRPEGREREHWEMAKELVAQEDAPDVATKPNPAAISTDDPARADTLESPTALENQGDFPGLEDQGKQSPEPPKRRRGQTGTRAEAQAGAARKSGKGPAKR